MTEHTPTPWKADDASNIATVYGPGDNGPLSHRVAECHRVAKLGDMEHAANAEFIARACNNFDALVEALGRAARSCHHPACRASRGRDMPSRCHCHVGAARAALNAAGIEV